ncbi:MAG: fibronectin type III domain-containing protein [Proteobacteria bacterium]|nr:fibronectin type III domain-containing protein [Pseudomonadota bacterium]
MNKTNRYLHALIGFMVALTCLFHGACGRKGPPVPPGAPALPPVADLRHDIIGDQMTLSWSAPKGNGADALAGYVVMRSVTDLGDEPCAGCPILFERVTSLGPSVTEYRETVSRGKHYIYKVMAHTSYQAWSKDSRLIRFNVPVVDKGDS